jgi:hypothetical protein
MFLNFKFEISNSPRQTFRFLQSAFQSVFQVKKGEKIELYLTFCQKKLKNTDILSKR